MKSTILNGQVILDGVHTEQELTEIALRKLEEIERYDEKYDVDLFKVANNFRNQIKDLYEYSLKLEVVRLIIYSLGTRIEILHDYIYEEDTFYFYLAEKQHEIDESLYKSINNIYEFEYSIQDIDDVLDYLIEFVEIENDVMSLGSGYYHQEFTLTKEQRKAIERRYGI